jgi:hypothetical protein
MDLASVITAVLSVFTEASPVTYVLLFVCGGQAYLWNRDVQAERAVSKEREDRHADVVTKLQAALKEVNTEFSNANKQTSESLVNVATALQNALDTMLKVKGK